MSKRQLDFFRELLFPFPDNSYFTSRGYTYLKARTIKTRLDDVVGPLGWTAEYTATDRGYKCRLKICCPDHTETGVAWHAKEDGGGFEGMGQTDKKTGEWEENQDNDEKSAYTNSFRRAAADWGFGRELYKEGVPRWISDYFPNEQRVTPADNKKPEPASPMQQQFPRTAPKPEPKTNDEPIAATVKPEPRQPDRQFKKNFNPPTKPGKACFAWMKNLETHFNCDRKVVDAAIKFCTKKGWGARTDELDAEQLQELTTRLIKWIMTWDDYSQEFSDDYQPKETQAHDISDAPVQAKPVSAGKENLSAIKKSVVALCTSLVQKQTGRKPTDSELMTSIGEIAAMADNGDGMKGEVMTSLRSCEDKAWLINIQREAMRQIERAAKEHEDTSTPEEEALDEIPF